GFVVARFGLFLRQLQIIEHASAAPAHGLSLWFGTALIVVGVFVFLLSAWHHLRLVQELNRVGLCLRGRPRRPLLSPFSWRSSDLPWQFTWFPCAVILVRILLTANPTRRQRCQRLSSLELSAKPAIIQSIKRSNGLRPFCNRRASHFLLLSITA